MNLLVCMVTYNRLEYSKRTLQSFLDTVTVPFSLLVVDNHSTDGTDRWFNDTDFPVGVDAVIELPENKYPGFATNYGWESGLRGYPEATHLMRLDNDMELLPGWCDQVSLAFEIVPKLGQVGLDFGPIRNWPNSTDPEWTVAVPGITLSSFPGNIGGTTVIKRKLWDDGLRYSEAPWSDTNPCQEDWKLSHDITNMGYKFGHLTQEYGHAIDDRADYPEYYKKTDKARGMSQ